MIRETSLGNARVYWKSMAEMIVPASLWELSLSDQDEGRVFEAMSEEVFSTLMNKYGIDKV